MKANEIRELSTADIEKKIKEYKKDLFDLRFKLAVGQLEDTAQVRKVKKTIARMKTIISERAE